MSGFEDPLYNPQYYSIAPSHPGPDDSHYAYNHHHEHGDPTTGMTSSWMGYPQSDVHDLGGQFQNLYSTAYSHAQEEPAMFGTGGPSTTTNTMYPAHGYSIQGSNIEGQFPNVDLSYDDSWSGVGTPMPMGLDATNPFAYNVSSAYPMPLPLTSPMGLNPQAAVSTSFPTQNPVQNTYWGMDQFHSTRQQDQTVAQGQQLQDSQIYSQLYARTVAPTAAASNRSLQPRVIQPKKQSPLTGGFCSSPVPTYMNLGPS